MATLGVLIGSKIVFAANLTEDNLPIALSKDDLTVLKGKHPELIIRNSKPWNAETPVHLLDERITSAERMFVRNNGEPPVNVDAKSWKLIIDGESVKQPMTFTLDQLKAAFTHCTYQLTLECAGNGRAEFNPPAKGTQWELGAVSCGAWTGVRLRDVLHKVGLKADAVYIGYYGADTHLSGDATKEVISRGVPMYKALEQESMIAWALNGMDIPALNGAPLRLVFGGWPASTSGKWLTRIAVRNKEHDGQKMEGQSYRVPKYAIAPGAMVADEDMEIINSMPVKSIITFPKTGAMVQGDRTFEVRGHAWAGDLEVAAVDLSYDFGATWKSCALEKPANRLAWQHWKTNVQLPKDGYYELWVRATDSNGKSQPMVVPGWNPKGYLNNACHRIAMVRK